MFTIINPEDPITTRPLVVVIYGRPGIGKTSLAFTANDPMLLDFDGGLARSVKRKKAVQFQHWADVQQFISEGRMAMVRGGTVIIDTAKSMLDDFIGSHVISDPANRKKAGGISQTGFGAMKEEFAWFLRETQKYQVDVVFIAHAVLKGEGQQAMTVPAMTGGSFDILLNKADLIGFMETRNNRRILDFNPADRHIGKNCAEFAPIDIPHFSATEYETLLADIIETCKQRMAESTAEMAKANRDSEELKREAEQAISISVLNELVPRLQYLPDNYRPAVADLMASRYAKIFTETHLKGITTAEGFNTWVPSMNQLPEIIGPHHIRKGCKKLLNDAAVAAGFVFDQSTKEYVPKPAKVSA